jgi:outer membrane protein OmpA-like peptidoglycan-associated protein
MLLLALSPLALALDADTFEPSGSLIDQRVGLQVPDTAVGLPGGWYAGLVASYAHDPLVRVLYDGSEDPVVRTQVGTRLVGGYSFGLARVDAELPLYPYVGAPPDKGTAALVSVPESGARNGFALGDARISATVPVFRTDSGALAFAVTPALSLPTGTTASYTGAGAPGGALTASVAWRGAERLAITGSTGYLGAPAGRLGDVDFGSGLTAAAGAAYDVADNVRVGAELDGYFTVAGSQGGTARHPVEAHLYGSYGADTGLVATLGVGTGIVGGLGTPDARVVLGLGWRVAGAVVEDAPDLDQDDDGVLDADDACPQVAEDIDGIEDKDGCPEDDVDEDGVPDIKDLCKQTAEDMDDFEDGDGCPDDDNDRDRLLDAQDACPLEAGPAQTQGCPDGDGDSVANKDDACPADPGPVGTRGCPDRDKDDVPDSRDTCPDEARDPREDPARSDGCPNKRVIVTNGAIEIKDRIFFDTNKATIKKESFPLLAEIAAVINANPDITRIEVGGHTDNVGDDAQNLKLSQGRAQAVVDHLVKTGGVAAGRLVAVGYGETQPLDTNATESGRTTNRRVEFVIKDREAK